MAGKGPHWSCAPADPASGGGRERSSGDRHWREVGKAVWCGEVMATPRRMRAGVVEPTGLESAGEIWVPTQNWGL